MITISTMSNGITLCAQGETIDEVVNQIVDLRSAELALAFYQKGNYALEKARRQALIETISEYGSFKDLYDLFKTDISLSKEIETHFIWAFFEENVKAPRFLDLKGLHSWDLGLPPLEKGKYAEDRIIEFYVEAGDECSPDNAITYCINMHLRNQESVLIRLAKLKGATCSLVRDYFFETNNCVGLLTYAKEVEKVPGQMIVSLVQKAIDQETQEEVRNTYLYHALGLLNENDVGVIEELCGAFVSGTKCPVCASRVAVLLSKKIANWPDNGDKAIIKSFIKAMEDIVVENCKEDDDVISAFLLMRDVGEADRLRLFKVILNIYNHNQSKVVCIYYGYAKCYVPFKQRVACWLGLM